MGYGDDVNDMSSTLLLFKVCRLRTNEGDEGGMNLSGLRFVQFIVK